MSTISSLSPTKAASIPRVAKPFTLSPSELAVRALGRQPIGVQVAKAAGVCAMCGHSHVPGDLVNPFSPEDSFTDYGLLRGRGSKVLCGWCAGVWNQEFTQKLLKTVACSEGIFPAASNNHIAYWLMNPPEGQWLWVQGDQKRQHIVWRAPVNTSREVFHVRFGENDLCLRRAMLQPAVDAARRLAKAASANRKGAPLKSPFTALSRDMDSNSNGTLRRDLYLLADSGTPEAAQVKEDMALICSLTPGELWALTALLYADNPHRPERIEL